MEVRKKFACYKMCRDKVVDRMISEAPSAKIQAHLLSEQEHRKHLLLKLREECLEVIEEIQDQTQLIRELCDILEVVDGIIFAYGLSFEKITTAKENKVKKRGEYKKGIFIKWVKVPHGTDACEYLLNNNKYGPIPELSDDMATAFRFEIMVRDNYVDYMPQGTSFHLTKLSPSDHETFLLKKLEEEVFEVVEASSDLLELAEELGDVLEVIDAILFIKNIKMSQVLEVKAEKASVFGEFKTGLFLDTVDLPEGARLYNYCSANPAKYPVIESFRNSVKVLLINEENNLLLMRQDNPGIKSQDGSYAGAFWSLIGGKIEEGESREEAACREIYEETGLKVMPDQVSLPVWYGSVNLNMNGKLTHLYQQLVIVRLTGSSETTLENLTAEEAEFVNDLKWFSLDEIEHTSEIIYPIILKDLLRQVVSNQYLIQNHPIWIDLDSK